MASSKGNPVLVAWSSSWRVSVVLSMSTWIKDSPGGITWSFLKFLKVHNQKLLWEEEKNIYQMKPAKRTQNRWLFHMDESVVCFLRTGAKHSFIQDIHQWCGGGSSLCNLQGCCWHEVLSDSHMPSQWLGTSQGPQKTMWGQKEGKEAPIQINMSKCIWKYNSLDASTAWG